MAVTIESIGAENLEFGEIELLELGGKNVAIVLGADDNDGEYILLAIVETDLGLVLVQTFGSETQVMATRPYFLAIIASLTAQGE